MRKADMSIGLVVAAAIGAIVLFIMLLLVGGGYRDLDAQSTQCEDTFRGNCTTLSDCREQRGIVISAGASSCAPSQVCCQLGLSRGSQEPE